MCKQRQLARLQRTAVKANVEKVKVEKKNEDQILYYLK